MSEIGIMKEIDGLGRLVIPKELRQRYKMTGEVEIVATKDGFLLQNPKFHLVKTENPDIDPTP